MESKVQRSSKEKKPENLSHRLSPPALTVPCCSLPIQCVSDHQGGSPLPDPWRQLYGEGLSPLPDHGSRKQAPDRNQGNGLLREWILNVLTTKENGNYAM